MCEQIWICLLPLKVLIRELGICTWMHQHFVLTSNAIFLTSTRKTRNLTKPGGDEGWNGGNLWVGWPTRLWLEAFYYHRLYSNVIPMWVEKRMFALQSAKVPKGEEDPAHLQDSMRINWSLCFHFPDLYLAMRKLESVELRCILDNCFTTKS